MSSLTTAEKRNFEILLGMSSGYVLHFSDKTFAEFFLEDFSINIDHEKYQTYGTSKANRLRSFWNQDEDHLVGKVLEQLLLMCDNKSDLYNKCKITINRLLNNDFSKDLNPSNASYTINNYGQIGNIGNDGKDNFVQNNKNKSILSKFVKFSNLLSWLFSKFL